MKLSTSTSKSSQVLRMDQTWPPASLPSSPLPCACCDAQQARQVSASRGCVVIFVQLPSLAPFVGACPNRALPSLPIPCMLPSLAPFDGACPNRALPSLPIPCMLASPNLCISVHPLDVAAYIVYVPPHDTPFYTLARDLSTLPCTWCFLGAPSHGLLALKEQMGGQLEVALLGSYLTPDMYTQISDGCETSGDVDLREVEKLSDAALLELPVAFPKMKRLYTNAQALGAGICQPWMCCYLCACCLPLRHLLGLAPTGLCRLSLHLACWLLQIFASLFTLLTLQLTLCMSHHTTPPFIL